MKHFARIIMITMLAGCFGSEPQNSNKIGKTIPNFSILLPDSINLIHTSDIPKGKPIVLFYFSPYCPHCIAQTKKIIEDIDELKHLQFYFISSFAISEIKSFCKKYMLDKYPNIIVGSDSANLIADYYEIPGVPYLAIYDKNKKLNNVFLGKIYTSQMKKAIED